MTAHEALWIVKAQLQRTKQNLEALQVLEQNLIKAPKNIQTIEEYYQLDDGTVCRNYEEEE